MRLASMRGTRVADSACDPCKLLDAVKGVMNRLPNGEGFLSTHHRCGPDLSRQYPNDCADGDLTRNVCVMWIFADMP